MIDGTVTGVAEATQALHVFAAKIDLVMGADIAIISKRLESAMKDEVSKGTHAPGTPTGATPGGPPWRITGDLADSIRGTVGRAGPAWFATVGPSAPYGLFLEQGTSKMPAYPFVQATIQRELPEILAIIGASLATVR